MLSRCPDSYRDVDVFPESRCLSRFYSGLSGFRCAQACPPRAEVVVFSWSGGSLGRAQRAHPYLLTANLLI